TVPLSPLGACLQRRALRLEKCLWPGRHRPGFTRALSRAAGRPRSPSPRSAEPAPGRPAGSRTERRPAAEAGSEPAGAGSEPRRWPRPLASGIKLRPFAGDSQSSKEWRRRRHVVVQVEHGSGVLGYSRAPDYDKSQWLDVKFKLDLDFPNLPYLMDGKNKITQSNAILRYIARKHNMCGETEEERIRVDIMENQIMDFRIQLVQLCYSPDLEKLKPRYLEQLPGQLKQFSLFLGKFSWFAGEKLTFVDFLTYDVLDQNRMFEPKCLDEFPNLKAFMCRFEVMLPTLFLYRNTRRLS
uniref:Glutathione S-transferase n=2 Tax=Canis lupus familiaris TaxID=9615 RepID=A0A8P0TSN2_CANLF